MLNLPLFLLISLTILTTHVVVIMLLISLNDYSAHDFAYKNDALRESFNVKKHFQHTKNIIHIVFFCNFFLYVELNTLCDVCFLYIALDCEIK